MIFACRKYVQGRGKGIGNPLGVEIVKMLENLEAFTLKLLKDIVTNITEVAVQQNHKNTQH